MTLRCPCCGFYSYLRPYQDRISHDGHRVKLSICTMCTSIINVTNLEEATNDLNESLSYQENSSREFYNVENVLPHLMDEVAKIKATIQFMFDQANQPIKSGRAIDVGAGIGHMAAAACDFFDESWALEINRWTLDQIIPHYSMGERLKTASWIREVPGKADAIFMWHTLEHIPEAWIVGQDIYDKLDIGGVFYWQVPMYADKHVVSSHYTFFNAHSAAVFMERIGLRSEGFWFDEELQFLSALGRKAS